ncbi:MAG: SusC/RagA family TonB-linked outer membrane protein [Prevotella sp.]|nr:MULTISPECIES: SusC/RagA family TonB-linked outer membrane protein [unclassified Prevotella]MCH3970977.1 SusC/RagA family TonB-linked outer membrane protein [Prevotella sp.]MCH3985640.1 SusC/RagA family TonB-linked outer membrane protein [Prevotella sp.]MCH3993177.1 SusC/RagA family TonB-linked outer membrane protein [Prevotella sp.]MCH4017974.1 SusC/RagA family TonB-linked outer membrane protein [Prevotella sp.]MCH4100830.1 SusC/RagA family TonB-linked outer membrane protein [Prevotella sp.
MKHLLFSLLLFMLLPLTIFAQQIDVTGSVVDSHGEPLIGVSIKTPGSNHGTVTDMDGNFKISVNKGQVLEFSYVGFKTSREKASGPNLHVVMSEDAHLVDEVIATGYGSVSRKNLTTSIDKVNADDVVKTGITNMSQMLMGRAAGLQATMASAQPGGNVNITIRGGGEPLYVVDGVVLPSSSLESSSGGSTTVMPSSINRSGLAGLNPDDIESIEVLKDASASIYGINAANGVILITTKSGKAGKMRVSYDGSMSVVKNYSYIHSLNAQEYMTYANLFKKEQYLYNNKMAPYGPNAYDNGNTDVFSSEQIASAQTTDWLGQILRTGSISSHNVTVQGGSDKLQYYTSGNYYKQEGTVKNNSYERFILRSNVTAQVFPWMKITTSLNYNRNNNNNGTVGGTSEGRGAAASGCLSAALLYPSNLPIYDKDGNYETFMTIPNPVGMLEMTDRSNTDGFNANFTFDFDIIHRMLTAKLLYGYNKENEERYVYIPSNVYFDQMFRSRGSIQSDKRDNSTMEATVSFDHSFFNDALVFNAVAGLGRYFNHSHGLGISYTDINDALNNDNISAATGTKNISSYRTSDEKRSQFGRVSLDFLDRYAVTATLRRDGTDKFFKGEKYSWFPSVSAAWKMFNEKFIKSVKWINMLKLRASYGETGNDNLGTTLYGAYSAFGTHVMFDNNTTDYVPYYLVSKDYPNVTWEKTTMKNIGLDFSVLKDRVSGSFDYFWNDVTNMLGYANTEGLSMFSTYPINGGHIRRYGWDATINTTNVVLSDFRWTSTLTLSHYNAIWKKRFPNYDYLDYQKRKDEPVNALYFYRTSGIINSDMSNCPASQPANYRYPGCPIIKDLDGDGQITVKDVDMVNVIPKIYWGLGNTFVYKNWDLDIFVYSQMGLKKYNYSYDWTDVRELANQTSNQSTLVSQVYNSQTNPNGTIPGIAYRLATTSLPGGAGTDVFYKDASFLRVRNITLGYTFNASNLGYLKNIVQSIRIYADSQNPFTITKYKNFDPEVNTGGSYKGGKAEYPMVRTFSLGLKVQF